MKRHLLSRRRPHRDDAVAHPRHRRGAGPRSPTGRSRSCRPCAAAPSSTCSSRTPPAPGSPSRPPPSGCRADVINFSAKGSSVSKGESPQGHRADPRGDGRRRRRHPARRSAARRTGWPHSGWIDGGVVNAGDGTHEHPTQALLDAFTHAAAPGRRRLGRTSPASASPSSATSCTAGSPAPTCCCCTPSAPRSPWSPRRPCCRSASTPGRARSSYDLDAALPQDRRRDDAARPARADERRVLPQRRASTRAATASTPPRGERCPDHAIVMHPGPDEPRHGDRRRRRRLRPLDDRRAGRQRRQRPHGRALPAARRREPAIGTTEPREEAPMSAYLLRGARPLGGEPTDLAPRRRGHRRDRRRRLTRAGADGRRRRRAGRPARPRRPAHPPARARPRGRRDRRDRHRARPRSAASPPCTRWPTPTRSPTPPASSSRSGGSAARPGYVRRPARSAPSPSGSSGERLAELGAMADSAARVRVFSDDGHCVDDAVLMRRALEYVKAFDGVIAQHAQEPRLTEGAQMNEGDVSGVLGLTGLARGRRGGDHRPRRPARRARRLPAARLPRLDRRLGRDPPLGQGPRRRRHRRGHPAPPAADRRAASTHATTRSSRSTRRCAPTADVEALRAGAGRRHDRRRRHRPRPARRSRTRTASGPPPPSACSAWRPRSRSCSEAMVETGLLDWAGVADRMSVRPARHRPARRPRPAARRRRARQPRRSSTRRRARTVDPAAPGQPQPQHPLRRPRAAGPGRRDVPVKRQNNLRGYYSPDLSYELPVTSNRVCVVGGWGCCLN